MRSTRTSSPQPDDAELERAFRRGLAGDPAAYREFLEGLTTLLSAYFRNRLRDSPDEVPDLVQEVVFAVHARRHTYSGAAPLTAWIHAIARYKWIDWMRERKLQVVSMEVDELPQAAYQPVESWQRLRDALRLLRQLPDPQRRAIERVKLGGESIADAARALGMSSPAVKTSIHRGLKALAALMEGRHG